MMGYMNINPIEYEFFANLSCGTCAHHCLDCMVPLTNKKNSSICWPLFSFHILLSHNFASIMFLIFWFCYYFKNSFGILNINIYWFNSCKIILLWYLSRVSIVIYIVKTIFDVTKSNFLWFVFFSLINEKFF